MNKKRFPLALIVSSLLLVMPTIVDAKPIEHQLSVGVNKSTVIEIPSGFKAYKVWMDDSRFAELDTDTPIENGATLIYAVPRKTGSSRITIITRDSAGRSQTHTLQLTSSHSGSSPTAFSVVGHRQPVSQNEYDLSKLKNGLSNAIRSNKLAKGSMLYSALDRAIRDISSGFAPDEAAARNNIYPDALKKLQSLGNEPDDAPIVKPENIVKPKPLKDSKPEKKPQKLDPKVLDRIANLERRVDQLDEEQRQLEKEQDDFLAQVKSLNSTVAKLDQDFLALSGAIKPSFAYKLPLMGGDVVEEKPDIYETLTPTDKPQKPLSVLVVPESPKLSNHTIANTLIRNLPRADREELILWQSDDFRTINSTVRLLRRGVDLKTAITRTGANQDKIKNMLSWASIDYEGL